MTSPDPVKAYYDTFQTNGWDLFVMNSVLRENPDFLPESVTVPLQSETRANYLVLGSATTRNIGNMAVINQALRPGQGDKDTVTIIDTSEYTLQNHRRELDELAEWHKTAPPLTKGETPLLYPAYSLARADMRALPVASRSMDIVVSDYTLNFLSDPQDVSITLGEVARVLKKNGTFMVALTGHSDHPYNEATPTGAPLQRREMTGGALQKFPLGTYMQLAKEQGLALASEPCLSGTDMLCGLLQHIW